MEEIDLKAIFNVLWRKKADILIIVLAFFVIGCVYTLKFTTPVYSSSVTLVLVSGTDKDGNNSTITTSDITLNSKLVSTYSKLIKSKNVLRDVISNLNLEINEETLKQNISVSSIKNTELIEITVKNEDKELAPQIANEITKVFSEKVKEMYNINNIQLIDEADIPTGPSNINHKKDVIMFTIVGMIVAGVYILLLNMLDTTIKTPENVEKEFDLPVLASVPILRRRNEERRTNRTY